MFAVHCADTYDGVRSASSPATPTSGQDAVVDAVLQHVRQGRKLIGLGIGKDVKAAVASAETALRSAKLHAEGSNIRVSSTVPSELAFASEALLNLLARLIHSRTDAEWRVVDLMDPGVYGRQREVSAELGISTQAISHALRRSGWRDEQSGRQAAGSLLRLAEETVQQW